MVPVGSNRAVVVGWRRPQPLARTGMAATLALLKNTGDLKLGRQEEDTIGRARDMRKVRSTFLSRVATVTGWEAV